MSKNWMTFYWIAFLTLVVAGAGKVATEGFHVKRDLFSILPEAQRDASFLKAQNVYQDRLGKKMIFAITGVEVEELKSAMADFSAHLVEGGMFQNIQSKVDQSEIEKFGRFYFPYRHQLLNQKTTSELKDKNQSQLVVENLTRIYSPVGAVQLSQLGTDPFGYYAQFLMELRGDSKIENENGLLTSQYHGNKAALAFADISHDWQDYDHQIDIKERIESFKKSHPNLELFSLGLSNYMRAGVERAQIEISTIGLGSLVGATILLLWLFRSAMPLFSSVILLLSSIGAATLITHLLFGSIHFFTLILGSSLVGMIDDYSFHFFAQRFDQTVQTGIQARNKIRKSLTYSFLTTVIGFLFLFVTPFPVLKQLGIFSIAGFASAFLTIWTFYPLLPHKLSTFPKFWERGALWTKKIHRIQKSHFLAATFVLLLFSFALMSQVRFSDDVRQMQSLPKDLKRDDEAIRSMLGRDGGQTYALVRGKTFQEVMEREESLRARLADRYATQTRSLSQWLPSLNQQQKSYDIYQKLKPAFQEFYTNLNVPLPEISKRMKSLELPFKPLEFKVWKSEFGDLPLVDQDLGVIDGLNYSVVQITGGDPSDRYAVLNTEDIAIVNLGDDTSAILHHLRLAITWAAIAGWGLTYMVVAFLVGFKKAVHIILTPSLAVLLSLGLTHVFIGSMNLFNILAAILVFSLGIDYSFFFSDCEDEVYVPTLIAVVAAAITTGLSFGLMALSQTAAISGFGITIAIGITLSLVFSPFAVRAQ